MRPTPTPTLAPSAAMPARARGFTLVEVLVALFIMAILATMAWQGVDGMVRVRDGARDRGEQVLLLGTVIGQWEQDLAALQQTPAAPPLRFDGAALRLTRRTEGGLQLVVWTRQAGALYRWASPPVSRVSELQDWWIRSQQWSALSEAALRMLPAVDGWQVYYYQQGDNAWSNAQSTGNQRSGTSSAGAATAPDGNTPPPKPEGGEGSNGGGGNPNGNPGGNPNNARNSAEEGEALPLGLRLVLSLPTGSLTRDVLLPSGL